VHYTDHVVEISRWSFALSSLWLRNATDRRFFWSADGCFSPLDIVAACDIRSGILLGSRGHVERNMSATSAIRFYLDVDAVESHDLESTELVVDCHDL
jgi:hypothetical protein